MSSANQNLDISYGLSQPTVQMNPRTIIANRAPGNSDMKPLGTLWIYKSTNAAYILTSIVANIPTWSDVTGAAGVFASLTVAPGPIALSGTTTINTVGASTTFIGSAPGTGAVNIGNVTGNTAITGTLTTSAGITATTGNIAASAGALSASTTVTAGTSITATLGNITATNGNVVLSTAATKIILPGPISVMSGAGAPANGLALEAGDTYFRTDPAGATSRIYIASAANTWVNVTCSA